MVIPSFHFELASVAASSFALPTPQLQACSPPIFLHSFFHSPSSSQLLHIHRHITNPQNVNPFSMVRRSRHRWFKCYILFERVVYFGATCDVDGTDIAASLWPSKWLPLGESCARRFLLSLLHCVFMQRCVWERELASRRGGVKEGLMKFLSFSGLRYFPSGRCLRTRVLVTSSIPCSFAIQDEFPPSF